MYSPRLETFIRVADTGSFNKAAEVGYITSTAVIKQMNLLEDEVGVPLFVRTHRGLKLTKAGESLYKDAKYIIQYSKDSIERARKAQSEEESVIRIGTSPLTPPEALLSLWPRIHEAFPSLKFRLVPFSNTPENASEILANLGQNIDVIFGIFDEAMLNLRKCKGLIVDYLPLSVAVSIKHRLAEKDKITIEDLNGENLLLMHRNWSSYVDKLRDFLVAEHPEIHIVDFDFYDVDIFNRTSESDDILLATGMWKAVHPLLKVLPVEWDFSIPYGILYSTDPSDMIVRLLDALRGLKPDSTIFENP